MPNENTLISIIIPAFNSAMTLEKTVECCLAQTHSTVEVIIVDDCSSDNTADVAQSLKQRDTRVKLVRHEQNMGPLEGRRTGVQAASGSFVLFLDADDALTPDACKTVLAAQAGTHDIVQFSIDINYSGYVSPREKWMDADFNKAPGKTVRGEDVTHVTFLERLGTWSMCAKLFRKSLLVDSFERIPPIRLLQAEDAYNYFVVSTLANSFKGLPNFKGYIYNIDNGSSNAKNKNLSLAQYESFCTFSQALQAIKNYLGQYGLMDIYQADYDCIYREHLMNLSYRLVNEVAPGARTASLDTLTKLFPTQDVAGCLAEASWSDRAGFMNNFGDAACLKCTPRAIKTVAAYHNVMGVGGAERVLADLANLWTSMGYNVVILADEDQKRCVYDLSPEIAWVTLPNSTGMGYKDYHARAQAIAKAVERHSIDAVVNHQWWSPVLAWDMISFKLLNVPFVVYCHNIFRVLFSESSEQGYDQPFAFRHADGLVTMTDLDTQFWSGFNPRIWQTIDPLTVQPGDYEPSSLSSKEIVWVGRVSINDKQPHEAIEIMEKVVRQDPECHLTIVGPCDDKRYSKRLQNMISSRGLEQNITFAGPRDNVIPFYQKASILLITSRYEGYCLVLAEAKALGLPTVMYDMPYLTLAKNNRGIIPVSQGNQDAAAQEILQLLDDEQLRQAIGHDALDHIKELSQFDFEGLWRSIFRDLENRSPDRSSLSEQDDLWNMLLNASKEGLRKTANPSTLDLVNMNKQKGIKLARKAWHKVKWR